MADKPSSCGTESRDQKIPGNPAAPHPESHNAPDRMSESAPAPANPRAPRAPPLASAIETSAPRRENPAWSAKNPRSPLPPESRDENHAPLPASAYPPKYPARRWQTPPTSLGIVAWSAPYRGPAARSVPHETPSVVFPPDVPTPRQKNKHILIGIWDKLAVRIASTRSNDTPAGCAPCDRSWKCCNSRIALRLRSCGTAATTSILG